MIEKKTSIALLIAVLVLFISLIGANIRIAELESETCYDVEEICGDINDFCDVNEQCIDHIINNGLEDEVCDYGEFEDRENLYAQRILELETNIGSVINHLNSLPDGDTVNIKLIDKYKYFDCKMTPRYSISCRSGFNTCTNSVSYDSALTMLENGFCKKLSINDGSGWEVMFDTFEYIPFDGGSCINYNNEVWC